jgi:peptidyl-prolyl cis-trans isomerase SurA
VKRRSRALVALAVLAAAGCAGKPPVLPPVPASAGPVLLPPGPAPAPVDDQPLIDRVVAVVNEDAITMSELQEASALYLRESKETLPPPGPEREQFLRKVLARMIDHRLQIQEARREKIEVSDDELRQVMDDFVSRNGGDRERIGQQLQAQGLTWEQIRRDMRDSVMAQKIRGRRISRRANVTEEEIDAYVAENRPKLERDLKYHPQHIAVLAEPPDSPAAWDQARARIEAIRARLQSGSDFAEVARDVSKDGAAGAAGDLGWLTLGELQPLFEQPILRLQQGEVTEPIKSEAGYHVFRLEAREVLTPEMLAQMRQQARDILVQRKAQERFDEWVRSLRQKALIGERL